jgi:hypothetical protein
VDFILDVNGYFSSTGNDLPLTYSISGSVSSSGTALAGVTINLTGSKTSTATTDANGNYTIAGLNDGSYTVTPSKSGYTFNPSSSVVNINAANASGTNFVASANLASTYGISGAVSGAANVTITLSGAGSATTTTNGSGNFSFSNLVNGNYTLTPSKSGYTFSPTSSAANINGASIVNANFVATGVTASALSNVDIVFSANGNLNGMKADGTGKTVLKKGGAFDGYDYDFREMTFPLSGNKMAYSVSCGAGRFIRVMSNNLGNPTDLTTRCSTGEVYSAYMPAFSPDGTKIAFIGSYNTATYKGNYLSIMNSDGTNQHKVSPIEKSGDGLYYDPDERSPSFSADGTLIAFSTNRLGGSQLATIKLDGTGMQLFAGCTGRPGGCYDYDPIPYDPTIDWSTNTIYYMSANVHVLNNNGNLYKISLTGTNKGGPLTSSASFSLVHPSVSPDGSMVAFTQITGFSDGNIMLLNLNTNKITTISEPSFAPYNDYPVFVRR